MEKTAYPIRGKRTRSTLSLVARTRGRSSSAVPGLLHLFAFRTWLCFTLYVK